MKNTQGRPTTWTAAQVEQLIQMRSEGVSVSQIASRLSKTTGAVSGKISALRAQGKIVETAGESQETGELNELETEMSEIIKEQQDELQRLADRLSCESAARKELAVRNEYLEQEKANLTLRIDDLSRELGDTKQALADTEAAFDEYRRTEEGGTAIIEGLQNALMERSLKVERLEKELARVTCIALGVTERYALGGVG